MESEISDWPDEISHAVLTKDGEVSRWIAAVPKMKHPIIGGGGESAVFPINVKIADAHGRSRKIPMVLRSYSVDLMRIKGKWIILDMLPRRPIEEVCKLVRRQLEGHALLVEANKELSVVGRRTFNLPKTVRETRTSTGEPSILMTDLTEKGMVVMLEAKSLLEPKFSDEVIGQHIREIIPTFDPSSRRDLARQTIEHINTDIESAKEVGLAFTHHKDMTPEVDYPHQFSPWSVLIGPTPDRIKFMILIVFNKRKAQKTPKKWQGVCKWQKASG